jgi:nitroreductase
MSKSGPHSYAGIARVLRERRTIHDFTSESPPPDMLARAVDLARWAPNHHRTEPWHFYLLDRNTAARLVDLNAEIVGREKGDKVAAIKRRRWSSMPGWLVVSCVRSDDEIRAREDYAACCCAIHNMAIYLWDQGVGMKWTTGAVTRDGRFFEIVSMDYEQVYVVGLFWYGYPASVPTQHRKPVGEILSHIVSASPEG